MSLLSAVKSKKSSDKNFDYQFRLSIKDNEKNSLNIHDVQIPALDLYQTSALNSAALSIESAIDQLHDALKNLELIPVSEKELKQAAGVLARYVLLLDLIVLSPINKKLGASSVIALVQND